MRVVPQVIEVLKEHEVKGILDLGCGTGGFLDPVGASDGRRLGRRRRHVRRGPRGREGERRRVRRRPSGSRSTWARSARTRSPSPTTWWQKIDAAHRDVHAPRVRPRRRRRRSCACSARSGRSSPASSSSRSRCSPSTSTALNGRPPPAMDALDYHFIHPLSRQGEPRPKDVWQGIYEQAGMTLLARAPAEELAAPHPRRPHVRPRHDPGAGATRPRASLLEARRARKTIAPSPRRAARARVDEGYAVQDALVALSGARVVGWKLGATTPYWQKRAGLDRAHGRPPARARRPPRLGHARRPRLPPPHGGVRVRVPPRPRSAAARRALLRATEVEDAVGRRARLHRGGRLPVQRRA